MRTPVLADREEDQKRLEAAYANPDVSDSVKLFPRSNWEFLRWDRVDAVGFSLSVFVAAGIILLLMVLVSIGG
jgi:hypothetical protein